MDLQTGFDENLEISVNTPSGLRTYSIREVMNIAEDDLMSEFSNQAGTYAWWGAVLENEKHKLDTTKAQLERAESHADQRIRTQLAAEKTKPTEALVKRMIPDDLQYDQALKNFNSAKRSVGVLQKVVGALEQRKDMLMMVGSHYRREYEGSGESRAKASRSAEDETIDNLKARVKERMK